MFKPKTSGSDFTAAALPHTRKEVFNDVLKQHFAKLFLIGLLVLLCLLPIHILAIAEDIYGATLLQALKNAPTEENAAKYAQSIITFNNIVSAANIPLLCLFSIPFAGTARVIRQYAWEENVDFKHDFTVGVKQNWKHFILLALFAGIIAFICNYIKNVASTLTAEVFSWLGIIPAVLYAIFLIPIGGYAMVSSTVYSNKLTRDLRIGLANYMKNPFKTLLAVICCLVIFVLIFIPNLYCHMVGRIIGSLFIPYITLGWFLFSFNQLDKTVNSVSHPDLIGKGTFPISGVLPETAEEMIAMSEEKKDESNLY